MALLSLVAKLGLDKTGFEQGLNSATNRVNAFGSSLKATLAGAFSVAAVTAFLRSMEQTIGRIKDLSEQFAVTTDEVQNVDFALKQSGLAFEDLASAMARMGQARREAVEGGPGADELRKTFEKYKLTLAQLNSPQMRNFDLLIMMSDAMSRMNMTAREQVEIQDLLGPKAARLANVLAALSETKAPQVFTAEDIDRIDKASKAIDNLVASLQKMAAGPVARFAETLQEEVEKFKARGFKLTDLLFAPGRAALPSILNPLRAAIFGKDTKTPAAAQNQPAANAPAANDIGGLFEVDKNRKAGREALDKAMKLDSAPLPSFSRQGLGLTSADQLGRIGAFSGGGVGSLQGQMKKTADTLVEIRNVLAVRGIVIKDL